jgi:hypothetical protein
VSALLNFAIFEINGLANLQTDEQKMIPSAVCMPCFNRQR